MAAASFVQPTQDVIEANLAAFGAFYEKIKANNWLNGIHHEVTLSIQNILDSEFAPLSDEESQMLTPELVMETFCKHVELGLRLPVMADTAMGIGMSSADLIPHEDLMELALFPASIRVLNYLPALFATVFDENGVFGFDEQARSGMYYACGVVMENVWNSGRAIFSQSELVENAGVLLQDLPAPPALGLVKSCTTGRTCWEFVKECKARNIKPVGDVFMEWARSHCPLDAVFERDRQFASGVTNAEFRQNLFRQIVVFYFEFSRPSRLLNINAPYQALTDVAEKYYSGRKDEAVAIISTITTQTHQSTLLIDFLAFWTNV